MKTSRSDRRRVVTSLSVVALSVAWFQPSLGAAPQLTISEFLADNQTGLSDGDGVTSDWIEIYNAGDQVADLASWHLTDDAAQLDKWAFPDGTTLAAGDRLLVFASGKTVDDYIDPDGNPHTNFRLDAAGEYLALVDPSGVVVQHFSPAFPRQRPDTSYGRAVASADVIVAPGDPAAMFVPTDGSLGLSWTGAIGDEPFADAPADGWTGVTASVGFGTQPTSSLKVDFGVGFPEGDGSFVGQGVLSQAHPTPIGDLTVTIVGGDGFYDRGAIADAPPFDHGDLYRDFAFNNYAPTSTIFQFSGPAIQPDAPFDITFWAWDSVSDGVVNRTTTFTGVSGTAGSGSIGWTQQRPASNTDYTDTTTYISDGSGVISVEAADNHHLRISGVEVALATFGELAETDVEAQVAGSASSAYLRIPFVVQVPVEFDALLLDMQYDDGFVCYLNGTEVVRDNVPDPVGFDSVAAADRPAADAAKVRQFDLSDHLDLLRPGTNILAIHAVNDAVHGSDFLVRPQLVGADVVPGHYFPEPTPGGANSGGFVDFVADTTFAGDPAVFHGRGYYESPFGVTVATATPGASIAYTTDGSEPSPDHGTQVPAPDMNTAPQVTVNVSGTTVLRAMAYRDGYLPTNVDTQSYLFVSGVAAQSGSNEVDPEVTGLTLPGYGLAEALAAIPSVSIVTASENLWGPLGIYTNSTAHGRAWERPASVEYIQGGGGGEFQIDAGLRMHGGVSRNNSFTPKHSFRMYFRNEYGAGKLDFPLFEGSPVERFDVLVLKALSTDTWPVVEWPPIQEGFKRWERERASYIRDQWMRDSQIALSGESAAGRFVHVFLNGLYWGMYNLMERPTDSFQASHFGGGEEEYDVVHDFNAEGSVQAGTITRWNEMMALAGAGLTTQAAYQRIQGNDPDGTPNPDLPRYLNLDSLIDYMILHIFSGGDDWPNHNWWAARRRGPDSEGFRFFTWDQEITNNSLDRTRNAWDGGIPYEQVSAFNTPAYLYDRLRHNPSFQIRFGDRVHALLFNGGLLSPAANRARWARRSAEIDQAIVAESARWGDTRRAEPYRREVEWLANEAWQDAYWDLNHPIAVQRFRNVDLYPTVEAPTFEINGVPQFGSIVDAGDQVGIVSPPGGAVVYYTTDGSDPRLPGGGVSSSAAQYTAPFVVGGSRRIQARTFAGGWSALSSALFTVVPGLRVSEIMYNPDGSDSTEFIELVNISGSPIPIAGVRFDGAVEGIEFTFDAAEPPLGPGARIVVVRSQSAFAGAYDIAGMRIAIGEYDGGGTKLSNGGEQITLLDPLGGLIQQFTYNDVAPWPTAADGDGRSLIQIAPESDPDPNDPLSWRASSPPGGGPGRADSTVFAGDPNADADANGVPDLVDHALVDGSVPALTIAGDTVVFDFVRDLSASGVVADLQVSTDLSVWADGSTIFSEVAPGYPPAGGQRARFEAPRSALPTGRFFVRLRVALDEQ